MSLRLRPPRLADEVEFAAAHEALALEGFTFGLNYELGRPWNEYLRQVEGQRCGANLPAGWVPMTFLVADGHTVRGYWIS